MPARTVSIDSYAPYCNGVNDDMPALLAAASAVGCDGTVMLTGGKKYWLLSNGTLPKGVLVKNEGNARGNNVYDQAWVNQLGGFVVKTDKTLYIPSGSGLEEVTVIPASTNPATNYQMPFPQANSTGWTGRPLSTQTGSIEVDVRMDNCLVMGFDQAFWGAVCPRLNMNTFQFDCQNGIHVDNAGDPILINKGHGWPFATVGAAGDNSRFVRTGVAYDFQTNCDAGKVLNCFAGNYATGYRVGNVNGLEFGYCVADSPDVPSALGPTGFLIQGTSDNIGISHCQGVGQQNAVVVDLASKGRTVNVTGGSYHNNRDNHGRVFNGTLAFRGAALGANGGAGNFAGANSNARLIMQNNSFTQGPIWVWYGGTPDYADNYNVGPI